VATVDGETPIEQVALGERVRTDGDEACTDDDEDDLHRIELELPNSDFRGDVVLVGLLRTSQWIAENGIEPGKTVFVTLQEMGLGGNAHISSVSGIVQVKHGRGCLVTGNYSRMSTGLRELRFEGTDEPVRATRTHPFWSLDRNGWVPAGELRDGERVKTIPNLESQ
jgi:hypothetical protein